MRIVVLNDERRNRSHAVLAVGTGEGEVVLDNLTDRPVTWREVPHYRPVYSVNESRYWVHLSGSTDVVPAAS